MSKQAPNYKLKWNNYDGHEVFLEIFMKRSKFTPKYISVFYLKIKLKIAFSFIPAYKCIVTITIHS